MANEPTKREFTRIWQTLEIESGETEFAKTQTMKPSSQTRAAAERGAPFTDELPLIRGLDAVEDDFTEVELGGSIGEGGTARVMAANQVPLDRSIAIKRLRKNPELDDAMYALLQEAWVTGRLEHPNIVPVYRLGRDRDGDPAMLMKRIEGTSWAELLEDPSRAPDGFESDDPLDWHLEILTSVCDAIRYAHDLSIIHRDLKPENVMVGAFGEVYVVDWGLAVSVSDDGPPRLPTVDSIGSPAGTPAYMAPEMAAGDASRHGLQTDVYLLGAILHHVVSGSPPHRGDSMFEIMYSAYQSAPRDYPDDVPDRLAEICNRAMARDPVDRYPSAEQFRRALVSFKRHRRSLQLSDQAHERLDDFRELLDHDDPEEAPLYEIFGECRFGFEQALEVDDENATAEAGLQELMERMIEREIDQEGYKAASLLIADLPRPRPDLERRLENLRAERADREREFEKLKNLERQEDVERGRKSRSIFVFAMGILLAVFSFAPGSVDQILGYQLGYFDYFLQMLLVGSVIAAGLWIGRRQLFQNAANKRLVASFLWIFGGIITLRKTAVKIGVATEITISFEMLLAAVASGIIAVTVDRRVLWAAVPYFAGALLCADFPAYAHAIDALADLVGLGLLGIAWWPGALESVGTPLASTS